MTKNSTLMAVIFAVETQTSVDVQAGDLSIILGGTNDKIY